MTFQTSTRRRTARVGVLTKPAGGGRVSLQLPKIGILGSLYLVIPATVAGSLSAPNAFGAASIIRRVTLSLNSGVQILDISGPGYHWLYRDFIDEFNDPVPQSDARAAVTATGFTLDMVLPISLNNRDDLGLIMLQNEETVATLEVTWEADATVATGATVTSTCEVVMEYFEVPADPKNWPVAGMGVAHVVLEDAQAIPGAGDLTYQWLRGNTYAGVYHLVSGTGVITRSLLRAQQGNILADDTPGSFGLQFSRSHGRTPALAGALTGINRRALYDFLGTDGLGAYGSERDLINSARLTDLASVITLSNTGTLTTVRRQLMVLGA